MIPLLNADDWIVLIRVINSIARLAAFGEDALSELQNHFIEKHLIDHRVQMTAAHGLSIASPYLATSLVGHIGEYKWHHPSDLYKTSEL